MGEVYPTVYPGMYHPVYPGVYTYLHTPGTPPSSRTHGAGRYMDLGVMVRGEHALGSVREKPVGREAS